MLLYRRGTNLSTQDDRRYSISPLCRISLWGIPHADIGTQHQLARCLGYLAGALLKNYCYVSELRSLLSPFDYSCDIELASLEC